MTPVSVRIRYYCLSHLYPRGKRAAQLLCGHQAVWLPLADERGLSASSLLVRRVPTGSESTPQLKKNTLFSISSYVFAEYVCVPFLP